MMKFDLQLFGKGGGKAVGKILAGLIGGLLGGWAGAIMGISLFASIWGMKNNKQPDSSSVTRFDRYQETMSSGGVIPIVYGRRKINGNQTFHETDADANTLHKHVVLCEGEIEGIANICANGLLVPTGGQTTATVLTIQNTKWEDACLEFEDRNLTFIWNGQQKTLSFPSKDDIQTSGESYWEWQVSIPALIAYVNRLGEGWEAFPTSTTSNYPGEMKMIPHKSENRAFAYAEDTDLTADERRTVLGYTSAGGTVVKGKPVEKNGYIYMPIDNYNDAQSFLPGSSYNGHSIDFLLGYHPIWKATARENNNCYLNPINFECETVTGGTEYTFHDGDLPENYEQVGSYANMAWLDMNFVVSNELSGNPSVDAIIDGRRIYDTRLEDTIYSTNPAMCLRDFLLSEVYGLGRWIKPEDLDEDSFKEAANYCDEVIQFPRSDGSIVSKKRFELNMVIDSSQRAWDWIDSMLGCFQAYISINQGKIQLFIEKPSPIVYKFDDSNIFDLKVSSTPLEDTPNQYKIKFVDPKNDWKTVTAEVNDYADQKERGKIVCKEVELEGVTSQDQALRLGRFYRDYNFVSSFVVTFKTGTQAMGISCGDVVQITYKKVFVDMPFRITQMKETAENEFEIECRPYNESIYNDSLGASLVAYNYSEMTLRITNPPAPTNLKTSQDYYVDKNGGVHSTYTLTWDAVRYTHPVTYVIHVYMPETDTWDYVGDTPECKFTGTGIVGESYLFAIKAISGERESEYALFEYFEITGIDNPPHSVENLSVDLEEEELRISWKPPSDPDISHYEVTVNGSPIITEGTYITAKPIDGVNTISVVAVDNAGNKSEPKEVSVKANLAPGAIKNLKGYNRNGYLIITWDLTDRAISYQIEGNESANVYGNTYSIPATAVGTLTYTVRGVNEYGTGEPSTVTIEITDTNTIAPTLEYDLFDYAEIYENAEARSEYKFKDFDCKMKEMTESGSRYGMYIVKLEE